MNAVHGRAIQIGDKLVGIAVQNDVLDSTGNVPGNAGRARASRVPVPANPPLSGDRALRGQAPGGGA